jgi:hypothetical protein
MDLKSLFSKHHVEWRDRGANCAKGHVNIGCPFCKNDPSFHMSINESTFEYYCFRNPRHSGHTIQWLLKSIREIPQSAYSALDLKEAPRTWTPDTRNYDALRHFTPAVESQEALDYLESRLFLSPVEVCHQFGLKCTREGEWAGRLIVPLTIGWTARSMREHIQPRFRAHTSEDGYFLYTHNADSCIICEGAFDCMRISSVTTQFDTVGRCGKRFSAALLNYLREKRYMSIYYVPDNDVSFSEQFADLSTLRSSLTYSEIHKVLPPSDKKDFGATPENETRKILSMLGSMTA